jgi:hypothetical protein
MSTDISLTEWGEQLIAVALQRMAGPTVASVDEYDPVTNRAQVVPLVPLKVGDQVVELPKMSVPVEWYGGPLATLRVPLPKGALVSVGPKGHDHSTWFTTGAPAVPPTSDRRFAVADLVAAPMITNPAALVPTPAQYDALWAVLSGKLVVGDKTVAKPAARNGDTVDRTIAPAPGDAMTVWMTLVETICNGVAPGSFTALNNAFSFTSSGTVTATAQNLKAE